MRTSACQRNDRAVREMALSGRYSLTQIGKVIGTTRHRVKEYIEKHHIPNLGFPMSRPMERNSHWKGGEMIDKDGYVLVKTHDHPSRDTHNYIRKHRLVMEQSLGRYLLPGEVVHHLDGDKQNNTIDNLRLYAHNSDHLADTLKGHVPNWTEDGKRRIRARAPRVSHPR